MKPVIALVGRPNVGKSTLFNQLTKSRDALVADLPGLTRDRKYGDACIENKSFIVIDTGGIGESDLGIDAPMAEQSQQAIMEADIVLFLVDARAGLMPADVQIADQLRMRGKPIHLIVNKIDGLQEEVGMAEFHRLGLGETHAIAASHGRGVTLMMERILAEFPEDEPFEEDPEGGIRIAIIGRPNVGKSTLVNRLLGEERVVVYDMPGTTRDSIYIPFERQGQRYTLIDTAGVRRRGRVDETVEKFSVIKTLQAVKDANVVVMVMDAHESIVDQDLNLLGFVLETGRALVIAINKWDGMTEYEKLTLRNAMQHRFDFIPYVKIHLISAKFGTAVGDLYPSIQRAYESAMIRVPTNRLTTLLEDAVQQHQPPLVGGRRIKLRYCHMGGHNPPLFIIHGNQTESVPAVYKRYLENIFRKILKLSGTPVRIEFKTSENPFKDRVNRLTDGQAERRRRFVQTHKKAAKKRK
ncbi:ribosome biogenesis GTPase Der [Paraperlucidibaca wandonensis]|jgi:GTP-binding protein|uniref:GTPase Der n=1 Tax=Paraperlucidibaca wandonensis TaxID=1268273 RepID=A0ABW3HHL4_9GAMM|nr:ribosome biogenesis GTPase Der [Paraperlucidibaca sp.]MBQ0841992.1 ribosome biogenesis GTPase Der [Paraperlucidibaca sp.]